MAVDKFIKFNERHFGEQMISPEKKALVHQICRIIGETRSACLNKGKELDINALRAALLPDFGPVFNDEQRGKKDGGYWWTLDEPQTAPEDRTGRIAIGHVPTGHQIAPYFARGGSLYEYGEITLTLDGALFTHDALGQIVRHTQLDGIRLLGSNRAGVYLRQTENWTGIYTQPLICDQL